MANPAAYGYAHRQLSKRARIVYPPVCHMASMGLCLAPTPDIDLTLPPRDRFAWTLHHLDPVELVGPRTPAIDRVRPAHRACNASVGTRVTDSPRSRQW